MLELSTPLKIIEKTVVLVETQRKIQNLQQKELRVNI